MSLAADFNSSDYTTRKINDFVLGVSYSNGGGSTTYFTYDFLARIMAARTGSSDGGARITPFTELDSDSLETLRDRLTELGGKPPELVKNTKPTLPPGKRPLSL